MGGGLILFSMHSHLVNASVCGFVYQGARRERGNVESIIFHPAHLPNTVAALTRAPLTAKW